MKLSHTEYAQKKKVKEVDIQRDILQFLRLKGIFAFRVNTGGVMRKGRWCPSPTVTKGTSDIIGIKPKKLIKEWAVDGFKDLVSFAPTGQIGQFFAIEVKAKGGKVSQDQQDFLDSVREEGGIAIVAYSVNDVKAALGL